MQLNRRLRIVTINQFAPEQFCRLRIRFARRHGLQFKKACAQDIPDIIIIIIIVIITVIIPSPYIYKLPINRPSGRYV